jgi:hypothetical protein
MSVERPQALDEWEFAFDVTAPEPIPFEAIDALMDAIILWAESNDLGVGGSFSPVGSPSNDSARRWRFCFGLCVSRDDDLIPREAAGDLIDVIAGRCRDAGWRLDGGFRPFEFDP